MTDIVTDAERLGVTVLGGASLRQAVAGDEAVLPPLAVVGSLRREPWAHHTQTLSEFNS